MRLGVLGGTFDPPHLGHLALAAAAWRTLRLDGVVVVPAGDPYRKSGRAITPPHLRWNMTVAAVAPFAWAEASQLELDRVGPSYAWETLEGLGSEGHDLWFILGHDALVDLAHWNEPQRLVAAARLALAARPPAGLEVPPETSAVVPGIEQRIDALPLAALTVSSTELRRRVAEGRPTDVLLPLAVRRIVEEHGLYGAPVREG